MVVTGIAVIVLALVIGAAVIILVGILLNRSIAAYGLALPVLCASALIVIPARSRVRPILTIAAGLLLIVALGAIAKSSVSGGKLGLGAATSVQSRQVMATTTSRAIADFLPMGSGLGSFRNVHDLYENPAAVTSEYVVHAHDDYLELALETGVPGIILMLVFLAWWVVAVWRVWKSAEAGPFTRAASIASAAILAHSLVDFPLRTAAISACFGMCLAMLADRRTPAPADSSDLRPTRHFVLR